METFVSLIEKKNVIIRILLLIVAVVCIVGSDVIFDKIWGNVGMLITMVVIIITLLRIDSMPR